MCVPVSGITEGRRAALVEVKKFQKKEIKSINHLHCHQNGNASKDDEFHAEDSLE